MPRQQNKKNKYRYQSGRISPGWLLIFVAWIALLVFAGANRQNLIDRWRLHNYSPPATVSALVTQDTMTDYARKIFYVNHPSIEAKSEFSSACPNNGGEQTIVLGCYKGGQNGIFLLHVTDSRLDGVHQVTAAHEMLHGAYDRLSSNERDRVDAMLTDYYDHDLHDRRILSTIAAYKKSEPHDVVNEMHSVFGTEIATLPAGLQTYYKQYFTDRAQVTNYAAKYQQEFTSRQATVAQDDAQLKSLKTQIDSLEAELKTEQAEIDSQHTTLSNLRAADNIAAYNAGVPVYNRLVNGYNTKVGNLKSLVDQYNQLVASRNAVAGEIDSLVKDLSAQADPIQ